MVNQKNILETISNEVKRTFKKEKLEEILNENTENIITLEYKVIWKEIIYHIRYDKRFKTIEIERGTFYPDKKTTSFIFRYTPYGKIQLV